MAEFFVGNVLQFFNLFCFVLREEREQDATNVENVIEVPYSLPLDEAFPGTFHSSMNVDDNVGLQTILCVLSDPYKPS